MIRDRLRRWLLRGEVAQRGETVQSASDLGGSSYTRDEAFNYIPEGVAKQWNQVTSEAHRNYWAWRHPWAHKVCYQVPEFLWSSPIEVMEVDEDRTTEEGPVFEAMRELEQISFRDSVAHANRGEFIHGWAVLVLYGKGESYLDLDVRGGDGRGWLEETRRLPYLLRVPDLRGEGVAHIDVFWPSDLKMSRENYDELGWPRSYRYYYNRSDYVDIDATRCVLVRTRPRDRTFRGIPVIEPGWNDLIWSVSFLDSMAWALAKYGQTSLFLKTRQALNATQLDSVETAAQKWHKRGPLVGNANVVEDAKFVSPFDSLAPEPIVFTFARNFASSIGYPMLWLLGERVGAVEGSKEDRYHVNARHRAIQSLWKPTLWRLLASVNPECAKDEVRRLYGFRFALDQRLDEMDEAVKWQTLSQSVGGLLQVATANEVRENVLGLESIEGGDETPVQREQRQQEAMKQSFKFDIGGGKSAKDAGGEGKQRGEELKFVSPFKRLEVGGKRWFEVVDETWEGVGTVRGLCRSLHVSPNSLPKMRERYKVETGGEPKW